MIVRRAVLCSALLVLSTNMVQALTTCEEVQDTLLACLLSSDVTFTSETVDVTPQTPEQKPDGFKELCWHAGVMLECVREARASCPDLPVLSDPDHVSAVRLMEQHWDQYCKDTEWQPELLMWPSATSPTTTPTASATGMANDQPQTCDAEAALMRCNDIMADVPPGNVTAMCIPGEAYLACLTDVVLTCPDHEDYVKFDLQEAINTTRYLLQQECGLKEMTESPDVCKDTLEAAEDECSDYLSTGDWQYCRSLELYMECMNPVLAECPDPHLQSMMTSQYQHHCGNQCPEDVQSSLDECRSNMIDVDASNTTVFCRRAGHYLHCVDDLLQKCEGDQRLDAVSMDSVNQTERQFNATCL